MLISDRGSILARPIYTSPVPKATMITFVVGGTAVEGASLLTLNRAFDMASARSSCVSSPRLMVTQVTPRKVRGPAANVFLNLRSERATAGGERHVDMNVAVGGGRSGSGHE
jgi:hypothetical protein